MGTPSNVKNNTAWNFKFSKLFKQCSISTGKEIYKVLKLKTNSYIKICLFRIHTSITIWIVVIIYGEYAIATVPIRVPDLCMLAFFVRDLRYKIIENKMKYVLSH